MLKNNLTELNLHLFDGDGGASGDGAPGAGEQGSLAGVIYGKQDDASENTNTVTDRRQEFDKLTKGEWKKEFNDRVNSIVKSRLADDRKSQSAKQQPLFDLLAQKYGVDAKSETVMDDLMSAIQEDRSFWERGAMERGLTVDQYKQMQKLEQENAEFRAMAEQQHNQERVNALMEEADALKEVYPDFDFDQEMENPDLMALLRNNIPLRTAFEVIHKDEIMEGAMRYTAQVIQQKTVNNIKARGLRPSENGSKSAASATYKQNVADLTGEDIDEIMRRVSKGEKIRF